MKIHYTTVLFDKALEPIFSLKQSIIEDNFRGYNSHSFKYDFQFLKLTPGGIIKANKSASDSTVGYVSVHDAEHLEFVLSLLRDLRSKHLDFLNLVIRDEVEKPEQILDMFERIKNHRVIHFNLIRQIRIEKFYTCDCSLSHLLFITNADDSLLYSDANNFSVPYSELIRLPPKVPTAWPNSEFSDNSWYSIDDKK